MESADTDIKMTNNMANLRSKSKNPYPETTITQNLNEPTPNATHEMGKEINSCREYHEGPAGGIPCISNLTTNLGSTPVYF